MAPYRQAPNCDGVCAKQSSKARRTRRIRDGVRRYRNPGVDEVPDGPVLAEQRQEEQRRLVAHRGHQRCGAPRVVEERLVGHRGPEEVGQARGELPVVDPVRVLASAADPQQELRRDQDGSSSSSSPTYRRTRQLLDEIAAINLELLRRREPID